MAYGHAFCAAAKGSGSHCCSNKSCFFPFLGLSLHYLAFELHCFQLHVTCTTINSKNVCNMVVP